MAFRKISSSVKACLWLIIWSAFFLAPGPLAAAGQSDIQGSAPAGAEQEPGGHAPSLPREDETIKAILAGQQKMLGEVAETARKLGDRFTRQTATLASQLEPYEEEGRRLLVLANTFQGYPNPMQAIDRRIGSTIQAIDDVLGPLNLARDEASALLERVNSMSENVADVAQEASQSQETVSFLRDLSMARLRLAAVIAQYNTLTPSLELVRRLEAMRQQIGARLPSLWRAYYLQNPVPWLSPEAWADFRARLAYTWQGLMLRLPVELPANTPQWGGAALRFFLCLALSCFIATLVYKQYGKVVDCSVCAHIFRVSVPLICLGLSLLGASISAAGDFFRLFLAVGNLTLIFGQVLLAWDLRLLKFPDSPQSPSPFLSLMPLTVGAYILLYLPLLPALVLVIWTCMLVADMVWNRRRKIELSPKMQLERGVLDVNGAALWICLLVSAFGLQIISMGIYLLYVSCSLAIELSLGGMMLIGRFSKSMPESGVRAVLSTALVALAAPLVLVAAVISVLLWIGTVPGGIYLVQDYLFTGVSVGETRFSIFQILLVISGFYITRTVASMGSRFLSRLPSRGLGIDLTLIPPLQTAFTYAVWAIYCLLALRSMGLDLNNLALVAGGLSVGIGFGMQTIVNNFLSGLILIFSRTLQAGDVVEVGNVTGRVRKISVRATMVETYDNATIYVPNSELMAGRLTNWTRTNRTVRRQVAVGVAYGSDTERVTALLLQVAGENPDVLKFPAPSVVFADFGASSLDFVLRFWVRDYDVGAGTASRIRLGIEKIFRQNNIEVAFPQLDVHVKDLPPMECRTPANPPRVKARKMPRRPVRPTATAPAARPKAL